MTKRIRAMFDDPEGARHAVRQLLMAGAEPGAVTIMSSEPHLTEGQLLTEARRTRIPYFSLAGGVAGAAAGFTLVYLTSHSYPIVTGGMPLTPPLTTGIIMYETTAMGAIFAALGRMLWEARLPGWRAARDDYDPAVADGGVLVSLRVPSAATAAQWQQILADAGGREI